LTKKLSIQLYPAHVARKKSEKEKTIIQKKHASAHLIQYRFKIREGSPEGIRVTKEEMISEKDDF